MRVNAVASPADKARNPSLLASSAPREAFSSVRDLAAPRRAEPCSAGLERARGQVAASRPKQFEAKQRNLSALGARERILESLLGARARNNSESGKGAPRGPYGETLSVRSAAPPAKSKATLLKNFLDAKK